MNIRTIYISDDIYPQQLKEINNPPIKLFTIGNLELLKMPCVAIVGTRRSSPYGRWVATEISKRVADAGCCVVSGMAEGIDSAAHKGALSANGKTIAVLGTGIDVCFPKSNIDLYKRLSKEGLILSEYEPGTKGYPANFPMRNRIISGLSEKVVVVEGAYKSGSMITANLANEQGRDVYSVPGNINQPNSTGTNLLISDGATPILSIDDCLDTLGILSFAKQNKIAALSAEEKKLFNLVRYNPGMQIDFVIEKLEMDSVVGLRLVSAMELKGLLNKNGQKLYVSI